MPAWIIALIKIAIQIGSPYLLELVKKYTAGLPAYIQELITELINSLKNPTASNSAARKLALHKLKTCQGVGCEADLKGE